MTSFFEKQSIFCLLLAIVAYALYLTTFGATWTYDDFVVIVDNPDIKSLSGFLKDTYPGRPVRELSFLIDYSVFGKNPAGWHFQSILWHALNAILAFLFLQKLKIEKTVAFFAALVFLVHPIQVEVVANLSHRKDSLALFFGLLSAILYFDAFSMTQRKRVCAFLGALLCYIVAVLAKQNMYLMPIVFLAYELIYVDKRQRLLMKNITLSLSVFVCACLSGLYYLYSINIVEKFTREYPGTLIKMNFWDVSIDAYYRMVLKSILFMFSKIFYPVDLAVEYLYDVPSGWLTPWVIVAVLAIFLYIVLIVWSWCKQKNLFIVLLWVPLLYVPTSNLYPLSYFAADRYLYAPSLGLFAVVVYGLAALLRKQKTAYYAVIFLIVLSLSVLTVKQTLVWKDSESLWTNALNVSPTSVSVLTNYGRVLLTQDKTEKAIPYFLEAAKYFNWPVSYYYLGVAYEDLGMSREAIRYFCFFLKADGPKLDVSPSFVSNHLIDEYGVDCR